MSECIKVGMATALNFQSPPNPPKPSNSDPPVVVVNIPPFDLGTLGNFGNTSEPPPKY